ncbi:hypothetical protein JADG_005163 [Aureobasidium aubasidani]|nr:hypothetical protein JADG_005163 [Aureobasidium pullulans]
MNRSASGQQPLRQMTGNVFQTQPSATRTTPLASQRGGQTAKLGAGNSSWAFGMPMGTAGAPGLSNSSTTRTPLAGFAQAIGGSASQAPLDLSLNLENDHVYNSNVLGIRPDRRTTSGHYLGQSQADNDDNRDFPSLGPQPHQANNVAQAWNSTALRTPQQAPAQQRAVSQQQQQPPPQQQQQQQQSQQPTQPQVQQQQQQQQQQSRSVSAQTHESQQQEASSLESQYDGQSPTSGRAGSEQPQDEFPPLNNQPQMQMNARVNGYGHEDAAFGSESSRPTRPAAPPGIEHQLGLQQPPIGQSSTPQQPSQHSNFAPQMVDAPVTNQAAPQQLKPYDEMSEAEKWGLPGLLAKIRSNDAGSAFTMGVDINSLGLDLDSPEPLFATFSTPFADNRSRPVIPEFTLPGGYTVTNVPSLASRMPAFSDETLFFVFYQNPRDVVQELAAGELYSRDWRWHKELQQWMMKDAQMAAPLRVSERSERGVYIFFDANNWRRERREFGSVLAAASTSEARSSDINARASSNSYILRLENTPASTQPHSAVSSMPRPPPALLSSPSINYAPSSTSSVTDLYTSSSYSTPTHRPGPPPMYPPGLRASTPVFRTRAPRTPHAVTNPPRPALPTPSPRTYKGYAFGHLAIPYMLDEMKRKDAARNSDNGPTY